VILGDRFQDSGRALGGVGIERDHHAARITLENRNDYFRSEPERAADELVLGKRGNFGKIEVDVGAEPALMDRQRRVAPKLSRGLDGEKRQRPAISDSALRAEKGELMPVIGLEDLRAKKAGSGNRENRRWRGGVRLREVG
jgi:hypothetical protein